MIESTIEMIRYLHPVSPSSAQGLVSEVYEQIKRDFGRIAEPFRLHSPLPALLAGAWMACRETELVGVISRNVKEAVAASVSSLNRCPYCVDAHTIMLASTGDHDSANALRTGCFVSIRDERMKAIVDWALATGTPSNTFVSPPFSREEAPEIIGTAVFYHYINRLATALLGETPLPSNKSWLKSPLRLVAGLMFRRAVKRSKNVGESLRFLPPASESLEPLWAKANPTIAQAFARFGAAVEEVGKTALPLEVREQVSARIRKWQGENLGVGRSWVEVETSHFEEVPRTACRLALLVALSPHQIREEDILRFQKYFPGDEFLLGCLVWASFSVAQSIGSRV